MLELEKTVNSILDSEGKQSVGAIAANILRNKQKATGTAINSLRHTVNSNSQWNELTIFGVDYIKNLEIGTLPGTYVSVAKINEWANAKGLWQGYNYRANTISRRIYNSGSKLFRNGGRKDVYSNEEINLLRRISEKIQIEINKQTIL